MKYGEIVELGRHRLMCGDATRSEDVHALVEGERVDMVLTDPPYGMKCQRGDGSIGGDRDSGFMGFHKGATRYPMLLGDTSTSTSRLHYPIARALTDKLIIWGGQYFADFLPVNGGWLVWDKLRGRDHFSDCELAWTNFAGHIVKYPQRWSGAVREGSTTLNGRSRVHPTQKPVELHARILEDFTQPGDVILDCFGGSGTTLIACEITGRKCLMMELSPDYCDIICERYDRLTREGKTLWNN